MTTFKMLEGQSIGKEGYKEEKDIMDKIFTIVQKSSFLISVLEQSCLPYAELIWHHFTEILCHHTQLQNAIQEARTGTPR